MRLIPLAATAAFAALALAVPTAASAACVPQTQSVSDIVGDATYMQAPDITSVTVSIDASCTLTLSDGLSNRPALGPYDYLQWGLDVDNNPATGRAGRGIFVGDEYGVVLSGDGQARLFDTPGHLVTTLTALPFGASLPLSVIGATETSTIRFTANALSDVPGGTVYGDAVTDPIVFAISSAADAPPATPTAPAPPTTTTPAAQCTVPKLTGKTLAAAKASLSQANCALGAVHRHRAKGKAGIVLSSSPKAGTTTVAGTKVAVTVRVKR